MLRVRLNEVPGACQVFPNVGMHGLARTLLEQDWVVDMNAIYLHQVDESGVWSEDVVHVGAAEWIELCDVSLWSHLTVYATRRQTTHPMPFRECLHETWCSLAEGVALRRMPARLQRVSQETRHRDLRCGKESVTEWAYYGCFLLDLEMAQRWNPATEWSLAFDGTTVRAPYEHTHLTIHFEDVDGRPVEHVIVIMVSAVRTKETLAELFVDAVERWSQFMARVPHDVGIEVGSHTSSW